MDPILGAALIGGGTALLNGVVNHFSQRDTNSASMQIAKYQNEYNTEMWNKQNEYNSPSATMQRLVDAGINPRAYQQIGQFANSATPAPAANVNYDSPLGKLAIFQQTANTAMQLATTQQNIQESKAREQLALSNADLNNSKKSLIFTQGELAAAKKALTDFQYLRESEKREIELWLRDVKYDKSGRLVIPSNIRGIMNEKDLEVLADVKQRARYQKILNDEYVGDAGLGVGLHGSPWIAIPQILGRAARKLINQIVE